MYSGPEDQKTTLLGSIEELFTGQRGKNVLEGKGFSGKGNSRNKKQREMKEDSPFVE